MKLKKLRNKMGCLMLTSAMVLSLPQMAYASAAEETARSTEMAAADTELHTEPMTGTESETEPQTPAQTELESDSETEAPSETETETETQTETKAYETETESETEKNPKDDKGSNKKDPDEGEDDTEIEKPDEEKEPEDHSDANSNLTSNIIAGNGVYLSQLSSTYHLAFDENFEQVMNEIETDFSQWLEQPDAFLATNWQDVLAVYLLRTGKAESGSKITMDETTKEELEQVFFMMNIRSDSSMANKLTKEVDLSKEICALTVEDYAELRSLSEKERNILDKYASADCRKLCAIITASKGFVRSEVGEGISEERVAIVAAACSLVGKVGYFWGGKSYAIGWDNMWGSPMTVTASGSRSSGTSRGYGLDCSGFVCWSYYNGLKGTDGGIGNHTTTQWNASAMVDSGNAKPGDMVFYNSPIAGDQNHVGLVIGKNENGSLVVAHCSSSQNGVVVGEAWSSGFKYVRTPLSLS